MRCDRPCGGDVHLSSCDELKNELCRLEEALLLPEVRASTAKLTELLAEDFVEFGSSGRIFDKGSIIASLTNATQSLRCSVEDFSIRRLCDDTALVTYRILNWRCCTNRGYEWGMR